MTSYCTSTSSSTTRATPFSTPLSSTTWSSTIQHLLQYHFPKPDNMTKPLESCRAETPGEQSKGEPHHNGIIAKNSKADESGGQEVSILRATLCRTGVLDFKAAGGNGGKGGLAVVGVGLCRTGTMSTKAALEELLGGPCHHFFTIIYEGSARERSFWKRLVAEGVDDEGWRRFFRESRYRACMDIPCSLYYKDLLKAFPDAKFVLNVRDPTSWHNSIKNVLLEGEERIKRFPLSWVKVIWGRLEVGKLGFGLCRFVPPGFSHSIFSAVEAGREVSERFLSDWSEEVRRTIPAEQLLVFDVRKGWEPLCEFLGVPVPSKPFPRQNDGASLLALLSLVSAVSWAVAAGAAVIAGVVGYSWL